MFGNDNKIIEQLENNVSMIKHEISLLNKRLDRLERYPTLYFEECNKLFLLTKDEAKKEIIENIIKKLGGIE